LTREPFNTIGVAVTRGGTTVTGPIQSLTHTISDGGLVQRTQYVVQGVTLHAFTFDLSLFGGSDVFVY